MLRRPNSASKASDPHQKSRWSGWSRRSMNRSIGSACELGLVDHSGQASDTFGEESLRGRPGDQPHRWIVLDQRLDRREGKPRDPRARTTQGR